MLQFPCFKRCFVPIGMFVAVVPQPSGTSVTIKHDQHACLLELHLPADILHQLQLTNKHICSCVAELTVIYVTLASDSQICSYARTQLTGW